MIPAIDGQRGEYCTHGALAVLCCTVEARGRQSAAQTTDEPDSFEVLK